MCRNFAVNAGIGFSTPEEFFLGEEPVPFTRTFDPAAYIKVKTTGAREIGSAGVEDLPTVRSPLFTKTNKLDIVLCCGSPGAGKSTFYWTVLQPLGYERVNQDILKSVRSTTQSLSIHTHTC